ncbi:thioesterase II family protein [Frankia gtarii]|uniref:thioesterase II family protein n=1 Tax=Frankia gtarii TaxID=2950102 RepID=UPI0021C15778|nr:alpha/beta fold hydrolase [Frankia gtarii]
MVFPHAGGSANPYCTWAEGLPADGETWVVCYPGRESRLGEPLIDTMDELTDAITDALLPLATAPPNLPPLILLGHSMGASVAYETARRLRTRVPGSVARLVVSARSAPGVGRPTRVHTLPRDQFIDVLRAHGGTDEALFEHDELMDLVIPAVRNDYRLIETYQPPADPTLPVDVVAFAATDDRTVRVEDVLAWAGTTTTGFDHAVFPGSHFYLLAEPGPVIAELTRHLPVPSGRASRPADASAITTATTAAPMSRR